MSYAQKRPLTTSASTSTTTTPKRPPKKQRTALIAASPVPLPSLGPREQARAQEHSIARRGLDFDGDPVCAAMESHADLCADTVLQVSFLITCIKVHIKVTLTIL